MQQAATQDYNHLNEIDDPIGRARLKGIQESSYALDDEIVKVRQSVQEKQGVVQACSLLAARVLQECQVLAKAWEEGGMEHDESKIRADQTKKIANIITQIGQTNRNDLNSLRGQIEGINRVQKLLEGRFNDEVRKIERQARMEEDEADFREKHGGNGKAEPESAPEEPEAQPEAAEDAAPGNGAAEPKPSSTVKKKVGKKVAKKQKSKAKA